MIVPAGDPAAHSRPLGVVPLRWGEPVAVNIADAPQGGRSSYRQKVPEKNLTRAYQVRADRNGDGTAKLTVDILGVDGPHRLFPA